MIARMFNAHVLELPEARDVNQALQAVGVQAQGQPILRRKGLFRIVRLQGVGYREALIAKQEMLGAGGDAATPKGTVEFTSDEGDVILLGTPQHFKRFLSKMKHQPFRSATLAAEVGEALTYYDREAYVLRFPGAKLPLSRTVVMGILNVTPDSFADGGQYDEPQAAIARARAMVEEGAGLIDVGAESTRPGSDPVSAAEEWKRLEPVLAGVVDQVDVPVSVDTYKPETAAKALDLGVTMVNDVTGLRDPKMIDLVAQHDIPAVLMHMLGRPNAMQKNPEYDDVVADIVRFLRARVADATEGGIDPEKLVVDPGIGFGKTAEHNLQILRQLGAFRSLGRPILVGVSRKSFLGKVLDAEVENRLEGGLAAAVLAAHHGAHILRSHDVKATVRALAVADAIRGRGST
ncbi:MAG: dihydropteroate synthase [Thermoplasmata archaeon]